MLWPEGQLLIDVRVLRLLRVLRIFRLSEYMAEFTQLGSAASQPSQDPRLPVVRAHDGARDGHLDARGGRPQNGFTSILVAMYRAVTTMTTVGFGAVPTGIVTAEVTAQRRVRVRSTAQRCTACQTDAHLDEANFCWRCGTALAERSARE